MIVTGGLDGLEFQWQVLHWPLGWKVRRQQYGLAMTNEQLEPESDVRQFGEFRGRILAAEHRKDECGAGTGHSRSGNGAQDAKSMVGFLVRSSQEYPACFLTVSGLVALLGVFLAIGETATTVLAVALVPFSISIAFNKDARRRLWSVATFGKFSFHHLWRGKVWLSLGMEGTWRRDARLLLNAWLEANDPPQSSLRIILASAFFSELSLQRLGFETRPADTFEKIAFGSAYAIYRILWAIVCRFRGRPLPPTPNRPWIVATMEIGRGAALTGEIVHLAR